MSRLSGVLYHEETYDPGNVASNAFNALQTNKTFSIPGAKAGDLCFATFSNSASGLAGMQLESHVNVDGTVNVIFSNLTGGAINLASGTVRVWVISKEVMGSL